MPKNSEHTKSVDVEAEEHSGKTHLKNKKTKTVKKKKVRERSESLGVFRTYNTVYNSDDEYKRGTPTWEKRALQRNEEESNIKLWWGC